MKKVIFSLFMISACGILNAQTTQTKSNTAQEKPSDVSFGYTYDFDKVFQLLHAEMKASSKNKTSIEHQLMQTKDFPKPESTLNNEVYVKAALRQWIETHSDVIIQAYKTNQDIVKPFAH
jgi:hypothetical protein